MFERMCAAELFQGPVVLTLSIARDGLDLGYKTEGCASGFACAFNVCVSDYLNLCFVKNHKEGVKSIATNAQRHTSVPQSYVDVLWLPERFGW